MHASNKTQCPNCDGTFEVPKMLLHQNDAKARCRLCEHIFLVNQHLFVSPNQQTQNAHAPKSASQSTQNNSPHQQKTNPLDDDILIHDDMELDDDDTSDAISADYDDLEAMQAWLTDMDNASDTSNHSENHSPYAKPEINAYQNPPPNPHRPIHDTASINNKSPIDNIKAKNTQTDLNTANPIQSHKATRPTAKNDYLTHKDDDNWLEKLLEEKENTTQAGNVENDLSQLLATANSAETHTPPQPLFIEPKARVVMMPDTMQTSIASLLWLAGCLVLVLLLFAQYITFNLDTLVKNPAHAARLQNVCAIAACSLPHADITALKVSDIDIRASQIQSADRFSDINATLVNQSAQAQLFPSLKVSIYNSEDIIGEFIADPTEYLLSPQRQLAAQYGQPVLFTIPLTVRHIHHVSITPIY